MSFLISFYELKVFNDLEYYFDQVYSFVFLVYLNC